MKLVSLSITNFRSIKKAQNIEISDMTVLIGKNNEGKSNFLSALAICLNTFIYGTRYMMHRDTFRYDADRFYKYNWKRDFPVSMQKNKYSSAATLIKIGLKFSQKDVLLCKKETGLEIPSHLEIITKFKKNGETLIETSEETVNKKLRYFQHYINGQISFIYIPAVRTPEQAKRVMDDTIYSALSSIEREPKYQEAQQTIRELQRPILNQISNSIKKQLSEFLPDIRDVKIELEKERSNFSRWNSSFDIIINDGNNTSLDYKGDGVKSLAALGI